MKNLIEIFYKKKYKDNYIIIRILCFRFKRRLNKEFAEIKNEVSDNKDNILYQNGNRIIIYNENGEVINNPKKIDGLKVSLMGSNNLIEIYEPCLFRNLSKIDVYGNNCKLIFNKCTLIESDIKMSNSAYCFIDEGSTVHAYVHLACEKDLSLKIGKDCMFADGVAIWATDGHIIRDASTNEIINRIKNGIEIGDHCWIGNKVTIIKNTILADNTIVGAKSLVSGHFTEPNTIIAGNPAKVIKKNVIWDRAPLD